MPGKGQPRFSSEDAYSLAGRLGLPAEDAARIIDRVVANDSKLSPSEWKAVREQIESERRRADMV